jgi:hypothetical protein
VLFGAASLGWGQAKQELLGGGNGSHHMLSALGVPVPMLNAARVLLMTERDVEKHAMQQLPPKPGAM